MTHVFIVNDDSFKIHLNYMFAGTGAKDNDLNYLIKQESIHPTVERLLNGMNADISRVSVGDKVIFYLQSGDGHEGQFYGVFKVKDKPYGTDGNNLINLLNKKLIFRVELTEDIVYPIGVTEREALDDISKINHPWEMVWSLIYRKLKANRGCTMITESEEEYLISLIKAKNNNNSIKSATGHYDFDCQNNQIITFNNSPSLGDTKVSLDMTKIIIDKFNNNRAHESNLQAYILQNINNIPIIKVGNGNIRWIGNEVSCGVGMQSIDIMLIQDNKCNNKNENENGNSLDFILCELKDEVPDYNSIIRQLDKYIMWVKQYIIPNYSVKNINIYPTIIGRQVSTTELNIYKSTAQNIAVNKLEFQNLRYIYYDILNGKIIFNKV